MMHHQQMLRMVVLVGMAVSVTACSLSPQDEINEWMTQQRSVVKPRIEPIAEPVQFVPAAYTNEAAVSPFSSDKLASLLRDQMRTGANAALLAPEINRRKEPLEAVPLDAINMVGLLDKTGQRVALVRAENLLYQVKVGNYLGQNYGRITRISESEITVREIVQDAAGEWIERPTTLTLQEGSRK